MISNAFFLISFRNFSVPRLTTIANIVNSCSSLLPLICSSLPIRRLQVCFGILFNLRLIQSVYRQHSFPQKHARHHSVLYVRLRLWLPIPVLVHPAKASRPPAPLFPFPILLCVQQLRPCLLSKTIPLSQINDTCNQLLPCHLGHGLRRHHRRRTLR